MTIFTREELLNYCETFVIPKSTELEELEEGENVCISLFKPKLEHVLFVGEYLIKKLNINCDENNIKKYSYALLTFFMFDNIEIKNELKSKGCRYLFDNERYSGDVNVLADEHMHGISNVLLNISSIKIFNSNEFKSGSFRYISNLRPHNYACINCDSCDYCEKCINCDNCKSCTFCTDCDHCEKCNHCEGCDHLKYCDYCSHCDDCIKCIKCKFCDDCISCRYCEYSRYCKLTKNSEHCNYCKQCTFCSRCDNLCNCKKCEVCEGCNHCNSCKACDNCYNCCYCDCKNRASKIDKTPKAIQHKIQWNLHSDIEKLMDEFDCLDLRPIVKTIDIYVNKEKWTLECTSTGYVIIQDSNFVTRFKGILTCKEPYKIEKLSDMYIHCGFVYNEDKSLKELLCAPRSKSKKQQKCLNVEDFCNGKYVENTKKYEYKSRNSKRKGLSFMINKI